MTAQKELLDFDLHLSKEGDRYFAKVSQSPAGESEKVQINIQFGAEPIETLRRRLADAVMRGPNPGTFPRRKRSGSCASSATRFFVRYFATRSRSP